MRGSHPGEWERGTIRTHPLLNHKGSRAVWGECEWEWGDMDMIWKSEPGTTWPTQLKIEECPFVHSRNGGVPIRTGASVSNKQQW
jgi:hypothetical protein